VRAAEEATRLVSRKPELATASTDANAAMAAGIPAIAIGGGGRGGSTHSLDEWFENDRAAAGAERALTIVATAARLPDDS
jgi:tripeptide aminopeptidase